VIKSFRSADTERLFNRESVRKFRAIERVALRKLKMLDAAGQLLDLGAVTGNRLEQLRGDRKGRYSIRINDQWRVCFLWQGGDAFEVEIVDYH
jgi:toxin HigB-1